MSESNIDIIVRTKREGKAPQEAVEDLRDMKDGLTDLEKAMAGTRSTVGGLDSDLNIFGKNVGSAADLLSGLGANIPITTMDLFGQALSTVHQVISDSLAEYSDYVMEVDNIATFTGMAAEETSKLIQVADDLRIETSALEMALKTMSQQGTIPTIVGIGQLSDQYLRIQNPLERANFLTQNFGRSGIEMARIMELGSAKIQELSADVADYMVVTGESREAAEAYVKALDDWSDAVAGLKYQIASGLIPALTSLIGLVTSPSADSAANVINTIFKGTFLESASSRTANATAASSPGDYTGMTYQELIALTRTGARVPADVIAQVLAGGRAGGGPVAPGATYKVGEREVEYLTLPVPGMVTPASSGGNTINFYYQPVVSLADRAEAQRILTPFIQEALR